MRIAQSFTVAHPSTRVWAFLGDVYAVAGCLAGAEVTRAGADGALEGRMTVRFGPIEASFAGEGRLARDDSGMTGRIEGQGLDQRSRSLCKGAIDFAVIAQDAGTRVELEVDYTLAGSLAQFSRGGLVNDLAARLTQDFATALQTALDAAGPGEDVSAPEAREALDAGNLLGRVLWQRIKAWLARLFGG